MDIVFASLNAYNVASLVARIGLGAFFSISGYHKLFNTQRHQTLVETLKACGIPCLPLMQWFVPCVELLGGIGLAFGFLTYFSAIGLMVICLVATCTDGVKRVASWMPVDKADRLDDYLYLPEVMYVTLLAVVLLLGPGIVSLDYLLETFWR